MEPISISALVISIVSTVGSIVVAIIQIFQNGIDCQTHSCLRSNCCNSEMDIHDNEEVNVVSK